MGQFPSSKHKCIISLAAGHMGRGEAENATDDRESERASWLNSHSIEEIGSMCTTSDN